VASAGASQAPFPEGRHSSAPAIVAIVVLSIAAIGLAVALVVR
jgi:hypothetical protein